MISMSDTNYIAVIAEATARERARIRRLIGPALRDLRVLERKLFNLHFAADHAAMKGAIDSVRTAMRPEPKRKRKVTS